MVPVLETDRLLLKPRSLDDFSACLAMDRDPAVTHHVAGPWDDPDAHRAFLRDRMTTDFGPGLGYWSLFPKASAETFIGWILLIPCAGIGPEIEIGWRLVQSAWGKGYASEAAHAVVRHAFETAGLQRIIADIRPDNVASIRVAEKAGLIFRGDGVCDGAPCKSYDLTAKEYRCQHGLRKAL